MRAEAKRLRRLQRLEQVRAHARQAAALEAARAEGTLARLEALAARTRAMAAEYHGRHGSSDGFELRQLGQFVAGLSVISRSTQGEAAQARAVADSKQQDLALAERRRAAVDERARDGARALARRLQAPALGSRRAVGTGLE